MEYKRLTIKNSRTIIPDETKEETISGFKATELYNRLAELEDKIENGTIIELPCKVDNISEITVAYKDYGNPLYAIIRYYFQQNKPYEILEYRIVGKNLLKNEDERLWEWYPSMIFSRIEDGFTSREQAEARLKELQNKE